MPCPQNRLASALKALIIALLNLGRSAGLRDVMRFPSWATGASTQFAPALLRSMATDGHWISNNLSTRRPDCIMDKILAFAF